MSAIPTPVSPRPRFSELPESRYEDGFLVAPCPICIHGTASMDSGDVIECDRGCRHGEVTKALFAAPPRPSDNGKPAPNGARLQPRGADLARVLPFRWAWERWLLLGYFNLLVGDEGIGKGTFLAWLVARLTLGELPGDLRGKPARVLLVGDEDGFDNVTVPRAHAAGADLALLLDLPVGDAGALDIARDADGLATVIAEHEIKVVIFDQLLDNLGGADDWRSKDVRAALAPIRRVAADLDVCFVGTLHTNKSEAQTFRQRLSGSQAFNALSRSSLFLTQHPDDDELRVLLRPKGNYSARPKSLEFGIDSVPLEINGHVHHPTRVVAIGQSEVSIEDALGRPAATVSKTHQARELIADELADGQWRDAKPIRERLAGMGLSEAGIKRAQHGLGIERRRTSGFPSTNEWRLARGGDLTDPTDPSEPTGEDTRLSRLSGLSETTPPRTAILLPVKPANALVADCEDDEPASQHRNPETVAERNGQRATLGLAPRCTCTVPLHVEGDDVHCGKCGRDIDRIGGAS